MQVQLTDPGLTRDLRDFLRRAECIVVQTGRDTLEVYPRSPRGPDDARHEVGHFLAEWHHRHSEVAAYLVD